MFLERVLLTVQPTKEGRNRQSLKNYKQWLERALIHIITVMSSSLIALMKGALAVK